MYPGYCNFKENVSLANIHSSNNNTLLNFAYTTEIAGDCDILLWVFESKRQLKWTTNKY